MRATSRFVSLITVLSLPVLIGGCPPPDGGNSPPVANAGPDQTVAQGAVVVLNGSGSSDPDGDALTFSWTQLSGTQVTLNNPDTVSPTFTAPDAAATLVFQLTVSDGQGATASDTVSVIVSGMVSVTPQLFIANFGGAANSVVSFANPATVNGNIVPTTNLSGAQTGLAAPADVVVDAAGSLIVANFTGFSITAYTNAATANGNFPPARNLQGVDTGLGAGTGSPATLAIDRAADLLFVGRLGPVPAVLVYANASTVTGNAAPTRTITTTGVMTSPVGIKLDGSGNLYVANHVTGSILVYANAANLNGNVSPTRTITGSPAFVNPLDIYVDSSDRLYVLSNGATKTVNIHNNASTLNGAVSPNFTLTIPGAIQLSAVTVDGAGRGYIVDSVANRVYSYDNIATRNGTLSPDRTIAGANTQISGPLRLFLLE